MLDRNRRALIDTAKGLSERSWFQRTLLGLDGSACDGHATGGDGSSLSPTVKHWPT